MKGYIYRAAGELTSPRIAQALQASTHFQIVDDDAPRGGMWLGFGSPKTWSSLQAKIAEGGPFLYGDHAYFSRGQYYRLTMNAYQHTGQGEKPDMRRLRRFHPQEKPYIKTGDAVIVCPQSQNHFDRRGCPNWLEETLDTLHRHTDRPILVHGKRDDAPLSKLLPRAWAVVCHSSNAAVEALMNGVPAFTTAPCAASCMTKTNLEEIEFPLYPAGRMEWAGVLAANQWTLSEIARGIAWQKLMG